MPAGTRQRGGGVVGYTNVEFWGEIKMKMQSWLSSESGKCPVSQDWVNTTQASVDKVEQTLTAKQLSTGRELRQPLTEELRGSLQEMGKSRGLWWQKAKGRLVLTLKDLSKRNSESYKDLRR